MELKKSDIDQLTDLVVTLGDLPPYITTTDNTNTAWITVPATIPSRKMVVAGHEFTVHPDGTVHIDPEALAVLLEKAGVE